MFQSSANRLRTWVSRVDDLLADHPDEAQPIEEPFRSHPHRRALRWDRERRPGSVPAAPAHCICPVRAPVVASGRHAATR
jgi:hypothetical protein